MSQGIEGKEINVRNHSSRGSGDLGKGEGRGHRVLYAKVICRELVMVNGEGALLINIG